MSALTRRSMARIAADNDAQWQSNRSGDAGRQSAKASSTRIKQRPPRVQSAREIPPLME
jgi:hypothetical protein